jgi:hypothetical protein
LVERLLFRGKHRHCVPFHTGAKEKALGQELGHGRTWCSAVSPNGIEDVSQSVAHFVDLLGA